MILSGEHFGILEPRETLFLVEGKSSPGMRWTFEQLAGKKDQFEPFKRIGSLLTDDFGSGGSFNGTLFRFPLRTSPSDLSKTIYSKEKIGELFTAFKEEASDVVLFLNSVKSVVLQDLSSPKESLTITSELLEDGETRKEEFLNLRKGHFGYVRQENGEKICVVTRQESVSVSWNQKVVVKHGRKVVDRQYWNMTSYISGLREMDRNLLELSSSPKVCSLPQVGIASRINTSDSDETILKVLILWFMINSYQENFKNKLINKIA